MSTAEQEPDDEPTNVSDLQANLDPGSIWSGILTVAAWHAGAIGLVFLLGGVAGESALGLVALCGIGLIQLLYVVPLVVSAYRRGRTRTKNGILIAAGITLLLNATCFGLVMSSFG